MVYLPLDILLPGMLLEMSNLASSLEQKVISNNIELFSGQTSTDSGDNNSTDTGSLSGEQDTASAAQIVLIVLLVAVSIALIVLSVKHHQTQAKLREYRVNRGAPQNFDNPLFSGQHTSADRYGSLNH